MDWNVEYDNEGPFIVKSEYVHINISEDEDSWLMEYLAVQDNKGQLVEEGDVTKTIEKESLDEVWDKVVNEIMVISEMGNLVE
jgi:hypothetical protein